MGIHHQDAARPYLEGDPVARDYQQSTGELSQSGEAAEPRFQIALVGVKCGAEVLVHGDGSERRSVEVPAWHLMNHGKLSRVTIRYPTAKHIVHFMNEWHHSPEHFRLVKGPRTQAALANAWSGVQVAEDICPHTLALEQVKNGMRDLPRAGK